MFFALSQYESVLHALRRPPSSVALLGLRSEIAPATLRAYRGTYRPLVPPGDVEAAYCRMPVFLERALLPFQREGVRYGLQRHGRVLIADEMGVGKTVQAIALASCYQVGVIMLLVEMVLIVQSRLLEV